MKIDEFNELQRLELNHRSLLKVTPEMVMLLLKDGTIEWMNPRSSTLIKHLGQRQSLEIIQQ